MYLVTQIILQKNYCASLHDIVEVNRRIDHADSANDEDTSIIHNPNVGCGR